MQFGLMLRSQYPKEENLKDCFANILVQVAKAEKLGFSSITKGSHYSTFPFNSLQQIPFLARIAAEVPTMRLNAGIVLLPLHKPLDIAEQIATLDIITNGKTMVIKLGNKKNDKRNIVIISTCSKFVNENNLVS